MPIRAASLGDIQVRSLSSRQLQWLVTPDTLGAQTLSIAVTNCPAESTVWPLHSHHDCEEVLLIPGGQGKPNATTVSTRRSVTVEFEAQGFVPEKATVR
jgi:hypothetical protein